AAGALVVTEAGGKLSDFSGAPLLISGDETLAANAQLHDQMVRVASEVKRSHVD
ncbi:MAG: Inositol-1-monophosphatase, partial [Deltaproteobacteria bacterium]|nr:Inositol-1-monophosphatase [Deltaproteobacteria bacterium]